jgi:uncharacterized protein DUF1573
MKGLGLVICLVAAATSAGLARAPQVVVIESDFDFGRVLRGTLVEHQFVVKNERAVPLVIDEVRLTPPLTLIGAPSSVAAGAQGVVRVRLDTSKVTGLFEGRIALSIADPDEPNINLTVTGTVYHTVEALPIPAFFVVTERGHTQQQSIELVSHESDPVEIKSVVHPTDHFATRLEIIEAGKRYRLTLKLDGTGAGGRRTDSIVVTTSSRTTPVVKIAANTFVRERVYTFPDSVDLGTFPITAVDVDPILLDKLAQTLMVYRKGASGFEVKVTTDVEGLDIHAARGPLGDRWQLTITLKRESLKPGRIAGSIFIQTNDPEFPRLRVPVSGLVIAKL